MPVNSSARRKPYRLLVTAGPTREMLDPVRFLSNVSTGHMGYQVARQAKQMGFQVTLISGPTALTPPRGVHYKPVLSAEEMKRAVFKYWLKTDALIMTAAVCDYTPVQFSPSKIKRVKSKAVHFKRTTDILEAVGKRKGNRLTVGFSLETESVKLHAIQKLRKKNLDLIVANWYGAGNNPFGDRRASMVLIDRKGKEKPFSRMTKVQIAKALLKEVFRFLSAKKS